MIGFILKASLLVAVFCCDLIVYSSDFIGRVGLVRGGVVKSNISMNSYQVLVDGAELFEGDEINTNKDGFAFIILNGFVQFQLGPQTRFILKKHRLNQNILEQGDYLLHQGLLRVITTGEENSFKIVGRNQVFIADNAEFFMDVLSLNDTWVDEVYVARGKISTTQNGSSLSILSGEYYEFYLDHLKNPVSAKSLMNKDVMAFFRSSDQLKLTPFLYKIKKRHPEFFEMTDDHVADLLHGLKEDAASNYVIVEDEEDKEDEKDRVQRHSSSLAYNSYYQREFAKADLRERGVENLEEFAGNLRLWAEVHGQIKITENALRDLSENVEMLKKTMPKDRQGRSPAGFDDSYEDFQQKMNEHFSLLKDLEKQRKIQTDVLRASLKTSTRKVASVSTMPLAENDLQTKAMLFNKEEAKKKHIEEIGMLERENQKMVITLNHLRNLKKELEIRAGYPEREFNEKQAFQHRRLGESEDILLKQLKKSRKTIISAIKKTEMDRQLDQESVLGKLDVVERRPSSTRQDDDYSITREMTARGNERLTLSKHINFELKKNFSTSQYDVETMSHGIYDLRLKNEIHKRNLFRSPSSSLEGSSLSKDFP